MSHRSRLQGLLEAAEQEVSTSTHAIYDPSPTLERCEAPLRRALNELLEQVDTGRKDLQAQLEELERQYDLAVYSELIQLLSNLNIEQRDAKRHWGRINAHRRSMERRLGTLVDPRVALLDYFVAVNCKLKNPTVIEMKLFEKTRESAYRDELTGLYNYRFFCEYLARETARRDRNQTALSLAVIDVDDFKVYNDRNGHAAGNEALVEVARLLTESVRREDIVARYGGEEFALILPATHKLDARRLAERARGKISAYRFPHGDGQPGGLLSVSIGIATLPADGADADELLHAADQAMYQAKAHGKNQVYLYGGSSRSHRRVDARLTGSYRRLAEESHPLTTVSLGDGGLQFLCGERLAEGALIEIMLELPGSRDESPILGRVIYAKKTLDGKFRTGVSLDESWGANRQLLARFVHEVGAPS